ncbi:MAG: lipoate---protein ligase [Actinomycetota bacterium]
MERHRARAAQLHALDLPDPVVRTVRVLEVTAPALVLGSSQPAVHTDAVDVVRRRSGGGAVLVEPGQVAWLDVLIPRDDPCWDDDVGRAFWWLGDAWASAMAVLGVNEPVVHRGALVRTPLSDAVCFAGLGPGEVTSAGAKALGMAQRRGRSGALFQCAAPLAWDGERLAALLGLGEHDIAVHPLEGRSGDEVADALLAQLPG